MAHEPSIPSIPGGGGEGGGGGRGALSVNVWLHGDSLEWPNWDLLRKKINLLHVLHILAKRKKKENRCCFEEHSKTVRFHNHELMVISNVADRFLFLDAHADFDTYSNKEKNLKKR